MVLKHIQNLLPKGWDHKTFSEKRAALGQIVDKIIINADRLDLLLKTEDGPDLQSISVQLQKIGRKKVMMDSEGKDIVPTCANKDSALIKALVRARKWEKALAANKEKSLGTIAKTEDLQIKYVIQIYRLNFLAPRIKEAILDGTQPRTLSLSSLMEGVPPVWREQERLYGF